MVYLPMYNYTPYQNWQILMNENKNLDHYQVTIALNSLHVV